LIKDKQNVVHTALIGVISSLDLLYIATFLFSQDTAYFTLDLYSEH